MASNVRNSLKTEYERNSYSFILDFEWMTCHELSLSINIPKWGTACVLVCVYV
jgi:hypothetical protein